MMIEDDELRDIFKVTSEEHLQNLDNGLLHLEKCPDDREVLEALMREAHSLKGDANMLGVKDIGALAHQLEHILSQLQMQKMVFSQELGDRLADGITAIRKLVHEAVTGESMAVDAFRVLAMLMGGSRVPEAATPDPLGEPLQTPSETHPNGAAPEPGPPLREEEGVIAFGVSPDVAEVSSDVTRPASGPVIADVAPGVLPAIATVTVTPSSSPPGIAASDGFGYPDKSSEAKQSNGYASDHYRIETIRVKTHRLDTLMTQVGELTVTKIRIAHRLAEIEAITKLWEEWSRDQLNHRSTVPIAAKGRSPNPTRGMPPEARLEQLGQLINGLRSAFSEDINRLAQISDHLEDDIRTLRLLPLSTLFNIFPRMVRDLARQEGKQVELRIEGGDTPADKRILEDMKDPLMHLLRNSIDHGIESPSDRQRLNKPETATITLRSYQTPTHIVIEIQDDGRGLDHQRIQQTALKRGICRAEELATMTSNQIEALIFTPGFSTAPLVTEVSGRGVGLDVVQTNVEKLKGTIQVESHPGQGCLFRIQIGVTLATAHVLIVAVENTPYAIPVEFVDTTYLVRPEEIFTLEGRETILHRDQPISVVQLADLLELPAGFKLPSATPVNESQQLICVILQVGRHRFGVFVDDLVDEQDVVIKSPTGLLKRVRNVSGATILGTGEVCIVLNSQDLMKSIQRRAVSLPAHVESEDGSKKQTILLVEDSIATRTQEKRMLESAGYEVVTAIDGNDGFNKLQSQTFDAVISDVQMPNLDGLQLTAKVRQLHQYDEIPIVLITSLASDEDKRRGAEAGANAYITKDTLNQQLLVDTLQRLI